MSRIRIFVLLLGLFGIGTSLACGGLADFELPSAELTDPWKAMGVPVADGTVLLSDANTLTVQYKGDKADEMIKKYTKVIVKAGFKKGNESKSGDTTAVVFSGKKGSLSLVASKALGNTMVAATIQK